MSLPKWAINENCTCEDCKRFFEALTIAVEVLEEVLKDRDSNDRPVKVLAKEALRRISELGK